MNIVDKMSYDANMDMLIRSGIWSPFERTPEMLTKGEEMLNPYQLDAWVRLWRLSLMGSDKGGCA